MCECTESYEAGFDLFLEYIETQIELAHEEMRDAQARDDMTMMRAWQWRIALAENMRMMFRRIVIEAADSTGVPDATA